jgi:hypothetical protein
MHQKKLFVLRFVDNEAARSAFRRFEREGAGDQNTVDGSDLTSFFKPLRKK